jgi:hypothetical protein
MSLMSCVKESCSDVEYLRTHLLKPAMELTSPVNNLLLEGVTNCSMKSGRLEQINGFKTQLQSMYEKAGSKQLWGQWICVERLN